MKTLLINGSPHKDGNTARALSEAASALNAEGIETEIFWLGTKPVRGCIACGACMEKQLGRCAFGDDVCNTLIDRCAGADAFIVGSPTYYGQPAGALLAVLQRVFFAARAQVEGKPAAVLNFGE